MNSFVHEASDSPGWTAYLLTQNTSALLANNMLGVHTKKRSASAWTLASTSFMTSFGNQKGNPEGKKQQLEPVNRRSSNG